MQTLPLQAIPNQNFTTTLGGQNYDITLKTCDNAITGTIIRDGTTLASNVLCVAATPLLNYPYQENGNFMFLTANDDLPNYLKFGVTQFLIFASHEELESILNG